MAPVPAPWNKFLDGWALTHFLLYACLACSFPSPPEHVASLCFLGVAWEVVESVFREHPFYLSDCSEGKAADGKDEWWYGRWQDIVVNTAGIFFGLAIRKTAFQNNRKNI